MIPIGRPAAIMTNGKSALKWEEHMQNSYANSGRFRGLHLIAGAIAAALVCLVCGAVCAQPAQALTQKQQGAYLTKALNAYNAGRYAQAIKAAKKLPKYANEPCTKKMSKKMKKAYRKTINKWKLYSSGAKAPAKGWLDDFYVTDINNDGIADLILKTGTCEADYCYRMYTYKGGKAKLMRKVYASHSYIMLAYPKHKGIVYTYDHMARVQLIKGTFASTKSYRTVDWSAYASSPSKCKGLKAWKAIASHLQLKHHVVWDANYKQHIKWRELAL